MHNFCMQAFQVRSSQVEYYSTERFMPSSREISGLPTIVSTYEKMTQTTSNKGSLWKYNFMI